MLFIICQDGVVDSVDVAAELPVKDTLSQGFHRVVVKPFRIANEAGVWKYDAGHILVGSGKEEIRVPVRPFDHAIVDEMRIVRPLTILLGRN